MAIRMRELAVQMNNGVYTDSDRANAQLEVTALLAEIDKIANNAAFNEVKILDGTIRRIFVRVTLTQKSSMLLLIA